MKKAKAMRQLLVAFIGLTFSFTAAHAQFFHVSGRVTDSGGSGVWNVDLDVEDSITGDPVNISNDHTDLNGYYDIILLSGTFNIEYNAPAGTRLVSEIRRDVVVQSDLVIDVALENGFYLSGRVTNSQGTGVGLVDIDVDEAATGLRISTPRDDTDGNGNYLVVIPGGLFRVTYEPPAGSRLVAETLLDVAILGDTVIDVSLQDGFFVTGWAVDEGGVGLANIDLDVDDLETGLRVPTPRDNTDNAGFFSIVLPAGFFSVIYDPLIRDDLAPARLDSMAITADTVLDTVILLNGVKLSGNVTDSQGSPVVGANLDVTDPSTLETILTLNDNTDETGHYQVTIPPGIYDLSMTPPAGSGLAEGTLSSVQVFDDTVVSFVLGEATGVGDGGDRTGQPIPKGFTLSQNYPNPFNPRTSILFSLPEIDLDHRPAGEVSPRARLEIFDMRGQRVRVLMDRQALPGSYSLAWDGRDERGVQVNSGIYLYRLVYGPHRSIRKMVVLK